MPKKYSLLIDEVMHVFNDINIVYKMFVLSICCVLSVYVHVIQHIHRVSSDSYRHPSVRLEWWLLAHGGYIIRFNFS